MKIIVLNGSPKGETSVTMQYAKYMQIHLSQHEFQYFHITQGIRQIEKNPERFDGIIHAVAQADAVLWAFPLYVCTVHSHYMRFIELISERGAEAAFRGKYAAALSTSIHFFDNTAHSYMRAVCDDLGMRFCGSFSPEMHDLLKAEGRKTMERFAELFARSVENGLPAQALYAPVRADIPEYAPGPQGAQADNAGKKVLLITDANEADVNLNRMTSRLLAAFSSPVEVVRLAEANIKGGCLGCLKCGYDNQCVYADSDGIKELYTVKIKNADIIIFAGALKGRFLSSRFKTFVDRRFLMTHQPQMGGKQIAYMISGPLGQNHNVLEILQAFTELDLANLAGVVTDECGDPANIDAMLDNLASSLVELSVSGYVQPETFLGVGGRKIFRDEIYGNLRFVFRGDHKYYKKHGFYDFPQKNLGTKVMNAVMGALTAIPSFRKMVQREMKKYMVMPFQKALSKP